MTPEQKAAYIQAQSMCAMAEIAGMISENRQREIMGEPMANTRADFEVVPVRYGIHHNALIYFFDDGN